MGSINIDVRILDSPISIEAVESFITSPDCGGLALFVGKVRNQTTGKKVVQLEFEAYEVMALREMKKIAEYILGHWPAVKVAIHHRVGSLDIRETAVAIGVSCPHRDEAFAACSYAIDTLKQTVPIWKKEKFEDGDVWVAAHP